MGEEEKVDYWAWIKWSLLILLALTFVLLLGLMYFNPHPEVERLELDAAEAKINLVQQRDLQHQRDELVKRLPDSRSKDSLAVNSTITGYKAEEQRVLIDSLAKGIDQQPRLDFYVFAVDSIKSILGYVVSIPFVIILLILAVVTNRTAMRRILSFIGSFKTVEALGTKVELSDRTKADLEETVTEYQAEVKFQYDLWQQKWEIRKIFEKIVLEVKPKIKEMWGADKCDNLRFTLHLPDLLFKDRLYQLLDYYPGGEGRGRSFSIRSGIIGKSWRLEESQFATVKGDRIILMKDWGMTQEEVEKKGKYSFGSIVLPADGTYPRCIFYIDSTDPEVFGDDAVIQKTFCRFVQDLCETKGLNKILSDRSAIMDKRLEVDFFK